MTARVNDLWISGFTADTPVMMADGKVKPISKVQEGEYVLSFDPVTKRQELGLVTGTWASVMNDIMSVKVDGKAEMVVGGKQRFFTAAGEFKTAPDAESILGQDGESKSFTATKLKGKAKIFDITVMPNHAFYADGLAVHNGGGGGGGSKAPPPPPDPVVTAGKVGQPLTVSVNGNVIEVPPQPESAGQVSVAYNGTASSGYSSSPGVAVIRPVLRPIRFPRPPSYLDAINKTQNAIDTETTVCSSMRGTTGSLNSATKNSWLTQLDLLKTQVTEAKKAADFPTVVPMKNPSKYSACGRRGDDGALGFDQVLNQVAELRKYVSRQGNLSQRNIDFISGKCSSIDTQLASIKSTMQAKTVLFPIDPLPGDRIWDNDPMFVYYMGNDNDGYKFRGPYEPAPPNITPPLPDNRPIYWKHFDNSGRYYLDQSNPNKLYAMD